MPHEQSFKPCALIPVYNHHLVLRATVARLVNDGLPVILVDDGSDDVCKAVMAEIAEAFSAVTLLTKASNSGKGAAFREGLHAARTLGFSHALQIDADGQHNLEDVQAFLAAARANPDALVAGYPVYDASVPKHRLYGRYASHIWVWINTLSFEIIDSMCGFRVYPVAASCALFDSEYIGERMDFDGEIIVRWHWRGLPLVQLPTSVTYPADGISHFRLWRDNGRIALMHTRLFFGLLLRLPRLLWRKIAGAR